MLSQLPPAPAVPLLRFLRASVPHFQNSSPPAVCASARRALGDGPISLRHTASARWRKLPRFARARDARQVDSLKGFCLRGTKPHVPLGPLPTTTVARPMHSLEHPKPYRFGKRAFHYRGEFVKGNGRACFSHHFLAHPRRECSSQGLRIGEEGAPAEVTPPGALCAKEAPRRNPAGFATGQIARICVVGVP